MLADCSSIILRYFMDIGLQGVLGQLNVLYIFSIMDDVVEFIDA